MEDRLRYLAPTLAQFQAAWTRLTQHDAIAEVEAVRSDGGLPRSQFAARGTVMEGRRLVLGALLWGDTAVAPVGQAAGELSTCERTVVHLLTLGLTSGELAERLSISVTSLRTTSATR